MLVLTRKPGEAVLLYDEHNQPIATIHISHVKGKQVAVAIEAPKSVRILRDELGPYGAADQKKESDQAHRFYRRKNVRSDYSVGRTGTELPPGSVPEDFQHNSCRP